MQDPDVSVKRKTARFRAVKNRGTRGVSLLMLSPSGLSNRKPPLLSDSESGGSMSRICRHFNPQRWSILAVAQAGTPEKC